MRRSRGRSSGWTRRGRRGGGRISTSFKECVCRFCLGSSLALVGSFFLLCLGGLGVVIVWSLGNITGHDRRFVAFKSVYLSWLRFHILVPEMTNEVYRIRSPIPYILRARNGSPPMPEATQWQTALHTELYTVTHPPRRLRDNSGLAVTQEQERRVEYIICMPCHYTMPHRPHKTPVCETVQIKHLRTSAQMLLSPANTNTRQVRKPPVNQLRTTPVTSPVLCKNTQ